MRLTYYLLTIVDQIPKTESRPAKVIQFAPWSIHKPKVN